MWFSCGWKRRIFVNFLWFGCVKILNAEKRDEKENKTKLIIGKFMFLWLMKGREKF